MHDPLPQTAAADQASGLVVQNLSLALGRSPRTLLQGISFTLSPGEVVALLGGRGSGKTLLLQLLIGLKSPSQGQILWQGQSLSDLPPRDLRRQIAWLPPQPRLLGMTVGEAIAYPLKLQGLTAPAIQQRLDDWLGLLEFPPAWLALPSAQLPQDLAQGVALARALVIEPQLLLLDNPWPHRLADQLAPSNPSSLHGELSQSVWNRPQDNIDKALTQLIQRGGSIIWASDKEIPTAQKLAKRLLRVEQGQLKSDVPATPTHWAQTLQSLQTSQPSATPNEEEDWS